MSEETAHARLSPSSMSRRITCPGSLALEERCPDTTSEYAEEGTAAHELMEWTFTHPGADCSDFVGRVTKNGWTVTDEMGDYVQITVDNVRWQIDNLEKAGATVTLFVEQRVDFSRLLGIPNQFGTADIVLLAEFPSGETLISVQDLKYGYTPVDAKQNHQLRTYAIALVDLYSLTHDITDIHTCIHQPRLDHVSEEHLQVAELKAWAGDMIPAAHKALEIADGIHMAPQEMMDKGLLNPTTKDCKFCRARDFCPAVLKFVNQNLADDFENEDLAADTPRAVATGLMKLDEGLLTTAQIARIGMALDLIEDFAKGIRGRIRAELLAGIDVPGKKLVASRRGKRFWKNIDSAVAMLKGFRLKASEIYERKPISPTKAEKMLKKENPRRWAKLQDIIGRPEGYLTVVDESDSRPAWNKADDAEDFDDETYTDIA